MTSMRDFMNTIRGTDILLERVEKVPFKDYVGNEFDLVMVWNPSFAQVKNLIDRSEDQQIRGLIVDNQLAVWDAYYVEYADIEAYLGLGRRGREYKIFIIKDGDDYRFASGTWWLYRDEVITNPIISRLLGQGVKEPPKRAP